MSVADACRNAFARSTIERGHDYAARGRVRIVEAEGGIVAAEVSGSRKEPYHVVIDAISADSGALGASCDCPHYGDGVFCKHIWATLLKADADGVATGLAARHRPLRLIHDDEWEDDGGDALDDAVEDHGSDEHRDELIARMQRLFDARATRALQSARPLLQRADDLASSSWRARLHELVGPSAVASQPILTLSPGAAPGLREVWFALDVAESRRSACVTLELRQREHAKTGTLGKLKNLAIRYGEMPQWLSQEDRELIEILFGHRPPGYPTYGYYGRDFYGRATIAPAMHALVLPRLCATGRFTAGNTSRPVEEPQTLGWDDGEPWRFRLAIHRDDARKCWRLTGRLCRGDETAALDETVLLLASGIVVFADRIARLDARREFPWITLLRRDSAVEIPYADRNAFLEGLYGLSHLPELDAPKDFLVAEERLEPRGRLDIVPHEYAYRGSRGLQAKVSFEYGKEVFALEEPRRGRFDASRNHVVVRDAEREKLLTDELAAVGLKLTRTLVGGREGFAFEIDERCLSDVARGLAERHWTVYARGIRIRRASAFNITVTSGVDWFDLKAGVDFEGVSTSLPALLAAVRQGESYVRLDDGSHGMLPDAWLERYRALARLAGSSHAAEAVGSLRFSRSQALLLDVLLAEQENVRVDAGYARLRDKLQSFRGVEPVGEPRGFKGVLRNYQKEGLGWLHFLREFGFGGCLADDMGLGKTVQALALLQSRRLRRPAREEERRPSIVVVPRSLIFNWIDEATRFTPALRVVDYSGTDRHARLAEAGEFDLMVTTYGTLRRDITTLKDVRFDYAILDEAQAIKNHSSLASKASRLIQADHRLAMSGTPVENHLGELWSLFEFLNPGMLGSARAFADFAKRSRGADDAVEPFARAMRPFLLRRTKQAVLSELPEKTEQTLHCELSVAERRLYDELREHYRTSLSRRVREIGMNKAKIHVLEALLRLRQAACHPGLLDKERAGEMSAKLETLLGQLEEVIAEGHKALVFSQFTSLLAIVRHQLDKAGVVYEYLDGRTRDRRQKVRRFQEDAACPVFLISLKAGGHGLNLTAADYVFILDPWWNPAVEAQAVDRAHRIGQTRRVFAYRIISRDTVEDKIVELQATKRALADAIVSADEGLIQRLTVEDLELLLGE